MYTVFFQFTVLLNLFAFKVRSCSLFYGEGMCDDFTSWYQLSRNIYNKNFSANCSAITVYPVNPIMLSNQFDITDLLYAFNFSHFHQINSSLLFNMIGINGIDLVQWQASVNNLFDISLEIAFEQSQITFYLNETLVSDLNCAPDVILPFLGSTREKELTFFNVFSLVDFRYKIKYPSKSICPYIFYRASMLYFKIQCQFDTILVNNIWRFEQVAQNSSSIINSSIADLYIQGYGYSLDTSLVNPMVFEKLGWLCILHSVNSIQSDIFKYFPQINIWLEADSLTNFFHRIGIGWTQSLNQITNPWVVFSKIDILFVNIIDELDSEYTYPDKDFCLFAQYPKPENITYILDSANLSQCTHTIRWLLNNYISQNMSQIYDTYPNAKQIYLICENASNETLDFKSLINKCNISHSETTLYVELYQMLFISDLFQDLVVFIAIPCACFFGIFFNVLIIWQVHKNKKDELKDQFYEYMKLNSVFNCLYCFIFLFYPINNCNDTLTSYFCSSIYTYYISQYYKIVFVAYLGEVIKLCANITYILINVNRYMLIGRDGHAPLLENISKWNIKWFTGLSVLFSLFVNIGHIFQYSLNNNYYIYNTYDSSFYFYTDSSFPIINRRMSVLLYIYYVLYFIVNYFCFFLVNTAVEVVLVRKLHKELKEKKQRMEHLASNRSSPNTAAPISFRKRRKQEIEERTEQRAILMVVINVFINFLLRLPDMFFIFSMYNQLVGYNILYQFFSTFPSFYQSTTDIAYFSYILTFTTTFFVYYLFNQKFRQTFSEWMHVKKKA